MATNKHRIQTFVESSLLDQLKFKAESENRSIASIVESVLINHFSGSNTTDIGTMLNQINNKLDRLFNHQLPVTSNQLEETTQSESIDLYYDDEIVEAYAPIVEAEEIEITQSESPKIHYFGDYFMAWEFSQAVKAEIVFTSERRAKKYEKFLTTLGRWEMSVIKGRPSFAPPHSKDAIPNTLTWKDDRIVLSMWSMSHCPKDTAFKDLKRLSGYDFSLDPDKQISR